MPHLPRIEIKKQPDRQEVILLGDWTVLDLDRVERSFLASMAKLSGKITLDLTQVGKFDTAAAGLLAKAIRVIEAQKSEVTLLALDVEKNMIARSSAMEGQLTPLENKLKKRETPLLALDRVGRAVTVEVGHIVQLIGFGGWIIVLFARSILNPRQIQWTSFVYHMEQVGLRAVPIVSLLTFLIGLVVMYMGAQQLARFGAQLLSINLLEVATLRELAPMLTAVVVAGRSGSAFTAQIGAMVANEEVSAMQVMGLDPMKFLVLPRVMALLFMLPALTVVADLAGLIGGATAAWLIMDMSFASFWDYFFQVARPNSFFTGLIKTPFFAVIIATIGCYHGGRVTGSASSVGALTTQSVVESIFMVITLDAAFALIFSALGV